MPALTLFQRMIRQPVRAVRWLYRKGTSRVAGMTRLVPRRPGARRPNEVDGWREVAEALAVLENDMQQIRRQLKQGAFGSVAPSLPQRPWRRSPSQRLRPAPPNSVSKRSS